jgi:glycerol-3-phosphate dehydrogenase subunit B
MSAVDVAVVGAGVAGTGAAAAAAALGASVLVVEDAGGASSLSTGALDAGDWELARAGARLPGDVHQLLDALGGYVLPASGARLLTTAGIVRHAKGHDAALLDVTHAAGAGIAVARCARPGWDADALARSWGPTFAAIDVTALRRGDERVLPDVDFASRHDDPERLGWLAERLREALAATEGRFAAVALPPSLGVDAPRAADLSARVGAPCGEAMGLPGGPAGARFERARDRLLAAGRVRRLVGRTLAVQPRAGCWSITVEGGVEIEAHAVVLATGGLLGGGIEYSPGESVAAPALPPRALAPFRLTLQCPGVQLAAGGRRLTDVSSSLFGLPGEALAWPHEANPLLERIGVETDATGRVIGDGQPGLFAAGDVVADAARTWLQAFASGVRAGTAAARQPVTGRASPAGSSATPL